MIPATVVCEAACGDDTTLCLTSILMDLFFSNSFFSLTQLNLSRPPVRLTPTSDCCCSAIDKSLCDHHHESSKHENNPNPPCLCTNLTNCVVIGRCASEEGDHSERGLCGRRQCIVRRRCGWWRRRRQQQHCDGAHCNDVIE